MTTINEGVQKIEQVRKKTNQQIASTENEILGIQEAVTKLWIATKKEDNAEEIGKRLSNILIGVFLTAKSLNVDDLEKCFDNRIKELEDNQKMAI